MWKRSLALALALLVGFGSTPAQSTDLPVEGGRGGGNFRADCGAGRYLRGVSIRAGSWVDAISVLCAVDTAPNGHLGKWKREQRTGGTGGSPLLRDAACPPDQFVIGLKFGLTRGDNKYIDWVAVQCIPIRGGSSSDICLHTGGGCPPAGMVWQSCPNFSGSQEWGKGIHGRSGAFVDALGLICGPQPAYLSAPRPAPTPPPAPPPPPRPQGFAGVWDTEVIPGGERYTIILGNQGGGISGAIDAAVDARMDGTLEGTLNGNQLSFTFKQPGIGVTGQGNFWLNGDSLDGRMTKNNEPGKPFMWTGTRRK
jgi:hypothetical protein